MLPTPSNRCVCMLLWTLTTVASLAVESSAVELRLERDEHGASVMIGDQLFTRYWIDKGPKPILWPVNGPDNKPLTRSFPMERGKGERFDHPHHRSLWFTHGDVNGIDFWSEGRNRGRIKHREFLKADGGEAAVIETVNDWLTPEGKKVCQDHRVLTFRVGNDRRTIDFDITISAGDEPVKFGDTKEGTFGVRVAGSMKVDQRGGKPGGKIINAHGQTNRQAWGKQAPWVDYHGPVDGKTYGIAILNHPSSFRFPTYWHVRTYGLFAANPFGLHHFLKSSEQDGSYTIAPGESITLRYRVVLHRGDEIEGRIAEAFETYAGEKKQ